MHKGFLFFLFFLSLAYSQARAQNGERQMMEEAPRMAQPQKEVKRSGFRQAMSKINFGISSGYGHTFYRQDLQGYSVVRTENRLLLIPGTQINVGEVNHTYSNWLSNPQDGPEVIRQEDRMVSGDTASLSLSGHGQSIPINLSIHINLMEKFKVGGGLSAELHRISSMNFDPWHETLGRMELAPNQALMLRYYGSIGMIAGRWYFWDFSPDVQLGKRQFLGKSNQGLFSDGFYYNFGCLIERHYSEYFRFTLRPSAEWSSNTMQLAANEQSLSAQAPSFYLQAGVSLSYPKLKRCPIKECHIQMEHPHFGQEYRGQPITKWQNPKYGQNHPELMRNKKRKRSDTENQLQYKKKKRKKFIFF